MPATSTAVEFLRAQQVNEDRLVNCPSIYGPKNGDGTCRTRQFEGQIGLADLDAIATRQTCAPKFRARISSRRFGPVVVGSLQHTSEVLVAPEKRFGHNHEMSRMLLCDRGPFLVEADGRRLKVDPGSGLMISGESPFQYQVGTNQLASMLFIDVATDDPVFAGIHDQTLALWQMPSPSLAALAAFVRSVLHSDLDEMPYRERVTLRHSLESLVLATLQSSDSPRSEQGQDTVYLRAMETIRRLHRNPDLSVDDVAYQLGISRRTFAAGVFRRTWRERMDKPDALR